MKKVLVKARSAVTKSANKFTNVSASRGRTAFPKKGKDQENLGIRCDFDGEIDYDVTIYNKFNVQPNADPVNSTVRQWRDKNGETHAVMGVMYVKKGGSTSDVITGWDNFAQTFTRESPSFEGEASGSGAVTAAAAGAEVLSSSEWEWWSDEGIYHRQINGVDEWRGPESDADSGWLYSHRQRQGFIKYANGTVEWQ